MTDTDTVADDFLSRWQGKDGTEKSNFQLFLSELCEMLEVDKPDPAAADNELNSYVFERRVDMPQPDGKVNRGFIDLYRRGCFVLEGKQSNQKLDSGSWDKAMLRAHSQADAYIRALPLDEGKPPFLLVTDVGRTLEIYAEFSRSGSTYTAFPDSNSYRLTLDDLRKPDVRKLLATIWKDPHSLDPSKKAARVTRAIANHLAELAKSLEKRHSAEVVGTFLMRCLFTMFSEDVGLLQKKSFTKLLEKLYGKPDSFAPALQNLWTLMDQGGYDAATMESIKRFNGGLFADSSALKLSKGQIQMLHMAAETDWRFVEPAIFGTLLERALNPSERHKLGAHYTPRAYVERLVLPTVIEPLREKWRDVQAVATMLDQKGKRDKAIAEIRAFHTYLCGLRILDPACGSANFLYVTLEHMKRLEGEVLNTLSDLGDSQGMLELENISVNPQQFLGIEVNPRAAAIAEMVLWIGYLQWHFRTHGNVAPAEPILRDFHNIENRDAVLAYDGVETVLDETGKPVTRWDGVTMKVHPVTGKNIPDEAAQVEQLRYLNPHKAEWPEADFIVGNPPFIGAGPMRAALGDGYVEALRKTWKEVPESSDFVMYWWHKAAEVVRAGEAERFGFITTNSLRQTFNRRVVQAHLAEKKPLSLIFAIPDHPWVDSADGAAVRIAMTVGQAGYHSGVLQVVTVESVVDGDDSHAVEFKLSKGKLHADISAGANIAAANILQANEGIAIKGFELGSQGFLVSREIAGDWLSQSPELSEYLKPYMNGSDLVKGISNRFVIDFFGLTQENARDYPVLLQQIYDNVRPDRVVNNEAKTASNWWVFRRSGEKIRRAINDVERYIGTTRTSKHRVFQFLDKGMIAESKIVVIALDDAFFHGVLSSRLHSLWVFGTGGWLGVGNDSTYNHLDCFNKFPFPNINGNQKVTIYELAEKIDVHRKRQQAQHEKLTITNIYNVLERLRQLDADPENTPALTKKEKEVHQQGLVAILRELHDDLDRAVFHAYSWDDLAETLVGLPGATTPLPDKSEAQAEAEEELLCRLVDLNTERAAEEAKGNIRWLRPEFQAPETVVAEETTSAAKQDEQGDTKAKATKKAVPQGKLVWPKVLQDQIKVVREQLALAPLPAEAMRMQFKQNPKGVLDVLDALVALGMVIEESGEYRLV